MSRDPFRERRCSRGRVPHPKEARSMTRPVLVVLAVSAALGPLALPAAAGPSLAAGSVRYEAAPAGTSTLVRRVGRAGDLLAAQRIAGRWTLPRVAADGT